MLKLARVELNSGEPVYISLMQIVLLRAKGPKTEIHLTGGLIVYYKGSVQRTRAMLNDAK